jgi:hypothetical protein
MLHTYYFRSTRREEPSSIFHIGDEEELEASASVEDLLQPPTPTKMVVPVVEGRFTVTPATHRRRRQSRKKRSQPSISASSSSSSDCLGTNEVVTVDVELHGDES